MPAAEAVLTCDLAVAAETRAVAEQANVAGAFDAVIDNTGAGYRERGRIETANGLAHVFAVNALAPFLLTALMYRRGG